MLASGGPSYPKPSDVVCSKLGRGVSFLPGRTHMPDTTDVFEIIRTTRAMRRLKPDPVPDALIRKIIEAGACAPNGGNSQRWRFLVVKDQAIKKKVQGWYKKAFDEVIGPRYLQSSPPPGRTKEA